MIISSVLLTSMFDSKLISKGEIGCRSLLGVKGSKHVLRSYTFGTSGKGTPKRSPMECCDESFARCWENFEICGGDGHIAMLFNTKNVTRRTMALHISFNSGTHPVRLLLQ